MSDVHQNCLGMERMNKVLEHVKKNLMKPADILCGVLSSLLSSSEITLADLLKLQHDEPI